MALFGRTRRFFRNLSLALEKAWNPSLWNLYGAQSPSGETVTEHTALTYSAVWNAVELISSTIAALPLNLMQGAGKTGRIADDYRLHHVMHSRWNPYMTAKRGRECQIAHVLTWGNGYAEIVRNSMGDVVELWPIPPHRVAVKMQNGKLIYEIRLDNAPAAILQREQVLHILGPSYDGFVGYSRIAVARKNIGLGMAMETFGSRFFGEGTHPGVIVEHPTKLSPEAHANLKKSLTDTYSGLGNSHRLMLLEEGMKFQTVTIDPKNSQFLESRQHSITDVARWFNLPPHKLKDLTKSSFNNIESEDASFIRDRLIPDLVELEQSYGMQLLTDSDRNSSGRGRLYFKHNVKGLLRADTAARTAFYTAMLDRGVFCIDDVLELEDMPPLPNGMGQKRFVQANMVDLENAGKPPAPAPAPPEREEEPPPPPAPEKGNGKDKGAFQ